MVTLQLLKTDKQLIKLSSSLIIANYSAVLAKKEKHLNVLVKKTKLSF